MRRKGKVGVVNGRKVKSNMKRCGSGAALESVPIPNLIKTRLLDLSQQVHKEQG